MDRVVKLVVRRGEEPVRPLSDWLLYGTATKTHGSWFYNSGKISEGRRDSGREGFWFLWPQRELRVNHAPFEIAVPHPRSISASSFVRPTDGTPCMQTHPRR